MRDGCSALSGKVRASLCCLIKLFDNKAERLSLESRRRACATAVSTGSETRKRRASMTTTPAVATPSATWLLLATMSASASPRPSRTPTDLPRDLLHGQTPDPWCSATFGWPRGAYAPSRPHTHRPAHNL